MNPIAALFDRRVRGFRVVELAGFILLLAIVFTVYVFKTGAGAEGARIADTTRQIEDEQHKVRLLKAQLAALEAPERLVRLSTGYLGMAPVDAHHETSPDQLIRVSAIAPKPAPAATLNPAPEPTATVAAGAAR